MKHSSKLVIWTLACGAMLTACWQVKGTGVDDDGTGGDADGDSDGDTDTDTDTSGTVHQNPITFVVTNGTANTIYLSVFSTPVFERELSLESWQSVGFLEPGCWIDCAEASPDGRCCTHGEPIPWVRPIEPGASHEFPWDGKRFVCHTEPCGEKCECFGQKCECFSTEAPRAGNYRVRATAGLDFVCDDEFPGDCGPDAEPDAEGVIWNAWLTDHRVFSEVEFQIPYSASKIEVLFAE